MTDWLKTLGTGQSPAEWYGLALALLCIGLWEVFVPKRVIQGILVRRLGAHGFLFILATIIGTFAIPISGVAFALAIERSPWGIAVAAALPWWGRFVLAILLIDLARYIGHWLFHAVGWLWRIHAIHHSDVEFDMATGLRHHPLEGLIMAALEFAAIALVAAPPAAIFLLSCVVSVHALFSHANAMLPARVDRVMRWFIITPAFHEIHHSTELAEQRTNLGNLFPWWDRLLGTACEQSSLGSSLRFGLDSSHRRPELHVGRLLAHPFVPARAADVNLESPVSASK